MAEYHIKSDGSYITVVKNGVSELNWNQKANLDSPSFTGTPTVPTAEVGTDTTQAASTKFVNDSIAFQTLWFYNTAIDKTLFFSDTTYSAQGFYFKADIPLSGVLSLQHKARVTYDVPEEYSGNYGPVATFDGGVSLYAKSIPSADFTIPIIECRRG